MINRRILKELEKKTSLSKSRVYELIDDMRKRIKAYSRETAANVLAAERGINVYSILGEEEIKEVREALKILHATPTPIPTETRKMIGRSVTRVMQPRVIQLKGMENFDVQNLPSSVINEASEMSYVYPIIYLFENSLRAFIKEVLDEENPDWWANVNSKMMKRAESRIQKEKKNRYHGRRGVHPIQYVDFDDLRNIIATNAIIFNKYMPDNNVEWLIQRLREVKDSRDILMHCNPITEDDIERVRLYFGDWLRQISGKSDESTNPR